MSARREYELSAEDHRLLLEACRAVPYMVFGGVEPSSPQENANRAWAALGKRLGFDGMSVEPVPGKGARFFTAIPTNVALRDPFFDHHGPDADGGAS